MISIKAREVSINTIYKILKLNNFSKEAINSDIEKVDNQDQNLYMQLVYGVIENIIYIDYVIQKYSKMKLRKLDDKILNILRIAVYELRFLESKKYAIINEAVKNTKKINFKAKNMVNAILRNIDRDENAFNINVKDHDEKLSIKYSISLELLKYIKSNYINYEEIIASFTDKSNISIRVNTNQITKEDLHKNLEYKGFKVSNSDLTKQALIIKNPNGLFDTDEFLKGKFMVQDEASILVSEILNPKKNSLVLDLCAAPGSKSTHLLQIMENQGKIISNDISSNKLEKIKENFKRLKLTNFEITNYDATEFINDFENKFDYILVDAPCSGLGVIKRKPEIKTNRSIKDIKSLVKIQQDILHKSYKYLKSGGYIVYSTCTIGDLENKFVVNDFIKRNKDIKFVDINGSNYIEILPDSNHDGFFICKMKKD